MLEHAWADIGHEMTYKTELKVPDRIHHEFASLAAVLEGVDRQFGVLVHGLEEFKSNFGAYHERKEVEAEIARLRLVLSWFEQRGPGGEDCPACAFHRPARGCPGNPGALHGASEPRRGAHARHGPGRSASGIVRTAGSISKAAGRWKRPAPIGRKTRKHCVRRPNVGCATTSRRRHDLFHRAVAVDAGVPVALARYVELEPPTCRTIPWRGWLSP